MNPIRIIVVDDHTIVRHGLRLMLELKEGLVVVGEARDGTEAVALAGELTPDVILMDLEMPRMSGIQAIAAIHASQPQIHILVLTSFSDSQNIANAIKNGAAGYLLKDSPPAELVQAIRDVARGQIRLPPEITQKLVEGLQQTAAGPMDGGLTRRELEVLRLAVQGLSNEDIAIQLIVSEGTIRFHFSNIFRKLNVKNRSQAIVIALQQGIVRLGR